MRHSFIAITLCIFAFTIAKAQKNQTYLQKQGSTIQLHIDNKPFLILGGELGNSSASSVEDIESNFPKLQRMGLNTLLVPAYWDLLEPKEGKFDFTLTDKVIQQARENKLKVIFLWFGAWKNSMSCYAPQWFKANYNKYPRAHTRTGKPLEIASAFSENVFNADSRAFSQLMKHIASIDKDDGTVIMIQIENEIGMLEDARDYSDVANKLFNANVPSQLINYLQRNKEQLHPQMLKKWKENGFKTKGDWQTMFGADIYTDEIFMAWYYASYVEKMAKIAKSIYNIPLYVNAAMNSRDRKPGEYPSAGPLAHLIDIWHCAAPSLDLLAPDLYDKGFTSWTVQYKLHNNPLFIPETRLTENDGVRAFYVFGEQDAIGFSPFSIEDGSETQDSPLVQAYAKLHDLMPVILKHQGKGEMNGLLFDQENKERIINRDGYKITCKHYYTLPWDSKATDGSVWPEGGGILIKLNTDEYLIAGSGIVITFEKESDNYTPTQNLGEDGFVNAGDSIFKVAKWNGETRTGIASVDEVSISSDGNIKYLRRMNGDQDHQGRHVRIPVGKFAILHVKLYEYK